jgi:AcrR family transcriptional regulator
MKTKDLIIEEFIKSFGANGFEGTSVDYLAKQVGIKKGSIYTHYSGKNEIFTISCEKILDKYIVAIKQLLEVERDKPLDEQLFILLKTVCLESDFLTADEIAFSKRVAILSSSELLSLVDKLLAKYDNFIDDTVSRIFIDCAKQKMLAEEEITSAISAYRMLLENLYIDSLSNQNCNEKLKHLWRYFWKGVCS